MKTTIRRIVAGLALAAAVLTLAPNTAAFAADSTTEQVAPIAEQGKSLVLSEPVWAFAIGVALPWLIVTITRKTASERTKAIVGALSALLVAVAARRVLLPDGSAVLTWKAAVDAFYVWLASVTSYGRFWTKVSPTMKSGGVLPKFGIR